MINVSLRDLNEFTNKVEEMRSTIENGKNSASCAVSDLQSNVDEAVKNTNDKIEMMDEDINLANDTISHNDDILKGLYVIKERQEKELASAESRLASAESSYESAKSSSSGSTPEEKKAHDSAVSSAASSVTSAENAVSRARNALYQTQSKINTGEHYNSRLQNIITDINRYKKTAIEYIKSLQEKMTAIIEKQTEFDSECSNAISKIDKCYYVGDRAREYISKGIKQLATASNSQTFEQVYMYNTQAITNMANLFRSMKKEVESFSHKQAKSSVEFEEIMGDDVSLATVDMIRDMTAKCVEYTRDFDDIADKLIDAKKYFDSYTALYGSSL